MKKRKIRKKRRVVAVIIFLLLLVLSAVFIKAFLNNKKEPEPIEVKKEEKKEELPKEKRMSLVAVGDALIHGAVYQDAYIGNNSYDFSGMFELVEPLIKDYDLKYYNQETIIGGKNLGLSHYPTFNSPDEIGLDLVNIGFNLISLANNHSMDKGERGINYSVNFWNNQEVVYSGQSLSFEDRDSIKIYEKNGIKYAFLAYTESTNGIPAPNGKEYLVNVYSEEKVKEDIDKVKDEADVIIVSMHWGNEYTHVPTESEKREAEYLSSLGVNLIIGSHPHVIQPVDYIGDTLVIYSLGNFISGQSPLGLAKTIGLMVGMDIVVKDDKVTFENIMYKLLYTYCVNDIRNYKVIPFSDLTNDLLNNYQSIEQEYLNIVNAEVNYD